MSPERRRCRVAAVGERLGVSQRRACRTLGQHRSVQRRVIKVKSDEAALTTAIIDLAKQYGRYGYRRITALLKGQGWRVNSKRVQRIWRQEGLKVPARQPKRGRLWLGDGSCLRLRPEHKNHVWAYDFVSDRTSDGRAFRMLTVVDEYTRECLAIRVERKLGSAQVLEVLAELFLQRGSPHHIRSDNGPEFCAEAVKRWLKRLGVSTLFIEPGSPWENGYVESFNGKLRDELLNTEVFTTLKEAQVLVEGWRTTTASALTARSATTRQLLRHGRFQALNLLGVLFPYNDPGPASGVRSALLVHGRLVLAGTCGKAFLGKSQTFKEFSNEKESG